MSYSGYGALGAIGFVVVMGTVNIVDRGMNYSAAKATVFRIDRECGFTRVYEGGKQEQIRQDCSATDEFKDITRSAEKRTRDIDGTAVVKVTYNAPQDGSSRTSELRFTGRDDEFYKLRAGDELAILVSNEDPGDIRLD
jgi:hypothetical protein